MPKAICPQCGSARSKPWSICKQCGLDPSKDDETLVRSVYLSIDRFEDGDDRKRYAKELEEVARNIASGKSPDYAPAEIERLRAQKQSIASIPDSAVWGAVFRLFLPAIVVFVILGILLYLKRI